MIGVLLCSGLNCANKSKAPAQWAAYAFDKEVSTQLGSGQVKGFEITGEISEGNRSIKIRIESYYLGQEESEIDTRRIEIDPDGYNETINTTVVECYKVQHRVFVIEDISETLPNLADITVWIPVAGLNISDTLFGICVGANYIDSEGHISRWSYILTPEMKNEKDNPPEGTFISYSPYQEGEFYGFENIVLYGLYNRAIWWFGGFVEGGEYYLEENTWESGWQDVNVEYSCLPTSVDVGIYTLDAWNVTIRIDYHGLREEKSGTFAPDLPIPIELRLDEGGIHIEYHLLGLTLR
jgi:hypothetical protein